MASLSPIVEDIFWLSDLSAAERADIRAEYKSIKVMGVDFKWHSMAYIDWKSASTSPSKTIVIVHGVSRNARDYDRLAQYLVAKKGYRCLAVDVMGRGKSDWVAGIEYDVRVYAAQIACLISSLNLGQVDYLGTSMGGLIGYHLAQLGTPIRKMVIVDVGPVVPQASLKAILTYLGVHQEFDTLEEAEGFFGKLYTSEYSFGATKEEIVHMARHSTKRALVKTADGAEVSKLILHYDLKIRDNFNYAAELGDLNYWPVWDSIDASIDILILRGANSVLFTETVANEMKSRCGAVKKIITFPKCGHAPTLSYLDQIVPVADFLSS